MPLDVADAQYRDSEWGAGTLRVSGSGDKTRPSCPELEMALLGIVPKLDSREQSTLILTMDDRTTY